MAILTICNHKGGTGKTTSSVHLAAAFGLMGHRVLVLDLDPQGFLTRTLGIEEPAREASSLALLDPAGDLRTTPVVSLPHFDLLGSSMTMTREQRRLTRPTDVFWLRETLLQGHDYDLILIDTAAAVSVFTMNALVASDAVVIPVTPEYQPVVGAEQTWQTAGLVKSKLNPGLETPRFLLTQVDGRLSRHTKYTEYLRGRYNGHVLQTPIRTSSSLAAASRDGKTVYDERYMSRGALDYAHASAEIARTLFPDLARPAPVEGAPWIEEDEDASLHIEPEVDTEAPASSSISPPSETGLDLPSPAPLSVPPAPLPTSETADASPEADAPIAAPTWSEPASAENLGAPATPAPPSNRSSLFHHAPVPGRRPTAPSSAPSRVDDVLEQTRRTVDQAAESARAALRAEFGPPPPSSGDGASADPKIRRFRF
ncbi:MAG: AAA family ATPase [Bacteroidota bacterium]